MAYEFPADIRRMLDGIAEDQRSTEAARQLYKLEHEPPWANVEWELVAEYERCKHLGIDFEEVVNEYLRRRQPR